MADVEWYAELVKYIQKDLPEMISQRERESKDEKVNGPATRMCFGRDAAAMKYVLTDLKEIVPEELWKA